MGIKKSNALELYLIDDENDMLSVTQFFGRFKRRIAKNSLKNAAANSGDSFDDERIERFRRRHF